MPRPFTHDQYAPLSYTAVVGDGTSRPPGARSWLDDFDARRLAAYQRLAASLDNVVRFYLPDFLWQRKPVSGKDGDKFQSPAPAEKYREYGDPALLVSQARSFVLGDEQTLIIPDAEALPDDAEDADTKVQERAAVYADWCEEWVEQEQLWLRLLEGEESTIGLGDGVYEVTWDADDGVPRVEVHDPGFYFPVLTGPRASKGSRYPNRVHLAWEEVDQETGVHWLYRKTYSREQLPDGEVRRYQYQAADQPKSTWTVFYTFARWDLSTLKAGATVYDLSDGAADFTMGDPKAVVQNRVDLHVDFVSVVHVPNDAAGRRHFGRSLLLRVSQILDELAETDTDLAATSADLGSPPVIGSGVTGELPVGPGAMWNTDAKLLDTSKALDSGVKYVDRMLARLSRNSRLAAALLGDVLPNEVPSGIALQLGFAPTTNLIRELRMVRAEKIPLIPKFAMRMAQQFQPTEGASPVLPDGATPMVEIRFGGFLPADKTAGIERVTKALKGRAISTLTAVQELIEDGWAIDDAEEEVARIEAENFDAAVKLFEATGDIGQVWNFLGLEGTPPGAPPAADGGGAGGA
jgi:hypothetical protein